MSLQRGPRHGAEQSQKKPLTGKQRLRRFFLSGISLVLTAAVVAFLAQAYLFQPIRVDGTSMEGTLRNGEIVLVSKLYGWLGGGLQRGDVVICRYPHRTEAAFALGASLSVTQHTLFIKRLVALPGDTVEIREGALYVNEARVPDPPQMGSTPRDYARRTLGVDEYFVMGDNRFSSHDSRADDVGPISGSALTGKVSYVIWPLANIRSVE